MAQTKTARVAIVRASSYDVGELKIAVAKSLTLLGGLSAFVKLGSKVFLKINHLPPPSLPERCIVTHPAFTEAVVQLLKETGADITIGDDAETEHGDPFAETGYRKMCERTGVKLVNLREPGFVAKPCDGKMLKEVYFARAALEADVFIDLAKFKTHSLCTLTGAVKNLYGCIPVGLRRRYHGDFIHLEEFCQMIADVYSVAPPHLALMDGVMAMEGDGPAAGKPRNLGVILAGRDAVAVDAVMGKIVSLEPWQILTTAYAGERGLGVAELDKIDIAGEPIASVAVSRFKLPAAVSHVVVNNAPKRLARFAISQTSPRPVISKKLCEACGECEKVCPTGAATVNDENAEINHAKCIRCMCCHEVCRFDAIVPRRPFFGQVIATAVDGVRKVIRK